MKDMSLPEGYQVYQRSAATWTASKLENGLRMTLQGSNGQPKLFRRPERAAAYCREHSRRNLSYREPLTTFLSKDHPEVLALQQQLQAQHGNIGKVSTFVWYANVDHLRTELYQRGWSTRLDDDQETVLLVPREQ